MSNLAQSLTQSLPSWVPRPANPERHLRPVPHGAGRRKRPAVGYAVISLSAIAAIVAVQLLLSVTVANGAYELSALQAQSIELQRDHDAVAEGIETVRSPQYLANNAAALGMITNPSPVFLRLSDGAVLGLPAQASGAVTASSLVPNELLAAVPLVTQQDAQEAASGTPVGNAVVLPSAPIPLQGGLPSPTTH